MIAAKLGLQQRIFPTYRRAFYELLADACVGGFSLFAGEAEAWEAVNAADALDYGELFPARNIHISKGKYYFLYQSNLMSWLKKADPDCLVMEANPRYLSSYLAIQWMHRKNRPVIGWGLGAPKAGNFMAQQIWQNFAKQFDVLIAYSNIGKADYTRLGVPDECVFVAPNAVLPAPEHEYKPRKKHNWLNILYVGRLQERKNIDHLIKACAAISSKGERIALIIVGDGPERENLQQLASRIFPQTKFPGEIHGEAVRPYFEQADLFVLPGTGGLAVQEALSYGLPVIVAEADGTQSNMVRPENGWVIPPDSPKELVKALAQAILMRENLEVMGRVSHEIASKEVNINQMVNVFSKAVEFSLRRREECEFL
jgi:glycosyltransferase involved in cell wall biosynthesis